MKNLTKIRSEVLKLPKETTPIDPEILDLIIGLHAFKIPTQFSCAGHLKNYVAGPYVDIWADGRNFAFDDYSQKNHRAKKAWIKKNITIQQQLIKLLTEFYKTRKTEYKYQISLHTELDWCWVRLKCIGSDLLQNMSIEVRKKELTRYQKEMMDFGKFLLKQYQKDSGIKGRY